MNTKTKWPNYSTKWWRKLAYLYVIIIFTIIAIEAFGSSGQKAVIRTSSNDRHIITMEIARTSIAKQKGLSNRKSICSNCGMLFTYKSPQKLSFWMKDTYFALDIAFLDENMSIMEIASNLQPFSMQIVSSSGLAKYALEMPAGYFAKNNIRPKDRLLF